MRIIGGEFRSRRLKTLPGRATRPTADRLRETLFDVLGERVAGSLWYDCYAGSGAVGLEALSRGAAFVVFIERARRAARVLKENIAELGVGARCLVLQQPVTAALGEAGRGADFIFLDPPYDAPEEYARTLGLLAEGELLKAGAVVTAEHARRRPLAAAYGRLVRCRLLEQGDSALSFYLWSAGVPPPRVFPGNPLKRLAIANRHYFS